MSVSPNLEPEICPTIHSGIIGDFGTKDAGDCFLTLLNNPPIPVKKFLKGQIIHKNKFKFQFHEKE